MGKTGTGAKAGALAGIVYGIFSGIFSFITLTIYKADVMKVLAIEAAKESALTGVHVTAASTAFLSYELNNSFTPLLIS